nr:helix-turn-helix domain-containing protein [Ardenticatena sp.]
MSETRRPYARLGELIDCLIRTLALVKGWRMSRTVAEVARRTGYAEATVYRWRQGRLRPPDDTLEMLVRLGHDAADLDRTWGEQLLRAARHPDVARLVNEIWGPKELRHIPHNLPHPEHTLFVGRRQEMARLLDLLSPDRAAHLITVDGIGGVGKTALVLEGAYRCLRASTGEAPNPRVPTFDAIVFVSAKQQFLTPGGILTRHQVQRTLRDIFHEIAHTLDRPDITRATHEEQPARVRRALARQRTLLIVDNLETVADRDAILIFLYDLPASVKVVITTREQALFSPIRLEQLPEEEGLQLILNEAREKGIALDKEQALALYERTGGIPAAMVYAVGQIAAGHAVGAVLERIARAGGDVARFCFESSIAPLRGQPAHYLLMAIAMFPKRPLREAGIHVAGLAADPLTADDGLARLQQLSLISHREGRFGMLPLTREYALAELAAHPDFERKARERWVEWYLNFAREHGGYDWWEWHVNYDYLEEEWENLLAVLDWCATHKRYGDVYTFWYGAHLRRFAFLYGYWDDYLTWQEWVIQAAERRGDWPVVVRSLSDKGWMLILMGGANHLMEADATLKRAWCLRKNGNPANQPEIASNIAVLFIRRKQYAEAIEWLDRCETLLAEVHLDEWERVRKWIPVPYYRAEICYRTQDHNQAEFLYQQVLEHGQSINWQRAVIYAQNWLADIAIARGELNQAERLLQIGLPVAERNKDRRRIAFYKRSFAYLEQKRGRLDAARRWAEEALDGFERLGMEPEAEEIRNLLTTMWYGNAILSTLAFRRRSRSSHHSRGR